jgi:N-acetylglutamate synthase-like GNAT family acetyltransferase/anti-sigma regulatory factor (Ser/Thr protein kinase)
VSRVKVTVLSDASAPTLVSALLPAFVASAGIPADDARRLSTVVEGFLSFTLDRAYPDDDLGEIEVTLDANDGFVEVVVHDWGLPLKSAGGELGALPAPLAALESSARNMQLLNVGSDGKRLAAEVPVSSHGEVAEHRHHIAAAPRGARTAPEAPDAIVVRAAGAEDTEAIAQLLYESYHLSYVHADFYRPTYLIAALASGALVSTIALHEERVIGHHAMMPLPGVPSAETGAAVVHSAYRGLGVFGRLFGHTLDAASGHGLASVFGDAVTLHPFSQRAERSHGYRETALQLGMVPARTTMRGFGGDGPRRRTATLRSYRPLGERTGQVALPAAYAELLEGVYANVGLPFAARLEPDAAEGEAVTTDVDEPRSLGFLRLCRWDGEARTELHAAVRQLLSRHVDVVYGDLDLATVDAVDEATAELNELGFFAAGLVLHGADGHDHLRLQLLDSEEIELEDIVCDSPFAEALKQRVLEDRVRVVG